MSTFKRFQEDDRGVMALVGVVGAAFLIGACWFVWGVGRATAFRENLQSAADSTAYLMSVYDARGMNIIAMINLIMSAVLAVLVIAKVIQAIVFAVNVITCIVLPPSCPATTAADLNVTRVVDNIVAPTVRIVLTGLSITESAIAVAWPLIPAGKSITVAADYEPQALATMGIGSSNIPPAGDIAVNFTDLKNIGQNLPGGASLCGYGGEFFLPVANDDYANLCGRAGENIVYVFNFLIQEVARGAPQWILDKINEFFVGVIAPVVGNFVSSLPEFFCMDSKSGVTALLGKILGGSSDGQQAQDVCSGKAQPGGEGGNATKGNTSPKPAECGRVSDKKGTPGGSKGKPTPGKAATDWEAMICSKTLSGGATMLDDNFANWGLAMGQYKDVFQRPVEAATILQKNKTKVRTPATANIQFAQSEFYYEPKTSGETKEAEEDPLGLDNTMWNMRWRARLRRVRTPSIALDQVAGSLVGKISDLATSKLPPPLQGPAKDSLGGFLEKGAEALEGQSIPLGPGVSPEVIH